MWRFGLSLFHEPVGPVGQLLRRLFALIDPIGSVPVFATAGAAAAGRRIGAAYLSVFITGFLIFFYFTGTHLLELFGISLPSFLIAGGVILLQLRLDMVRGEFTA